MNYRKKGLKILLEYILNRKIRRLAQDVLEIITVFSARLYGSRSRKNQKLVEAAKVLIGEDTT